MRLMLIVILTFALLCSAVSEEAHLRHVEKDVLIPKKMREKAKELCADKVEGGIFSCPH